MSLEEKHIYPTYIQCQGHHEWMVYSNLGKMQPGEKRTYRLVSDARRRHHNSSKETSCNYQGRFLWKQYAVLRENRNGNHHRCLISGRTPGLTALKDKLSVDAFHTASPGGRRKRTVICLHLNEMGTAWNQEQRIITWAFGCDELISKKSAALSGGCFPKAAKIWRKSYLWTNPSGNWYGLVKMARTASLPELCFRMIKEKVVWTILMSAREKSVSGRS